jgi:hypothetical protein
MATTVTACCVVPKWSQLNVKPDMALVHVFFLSLYLSRDFLEATDSQYQGRREFKHLPARNVVRCQIVIVKGRPEQSVHATWNTGLIPY